MKRLVETYLELSSWGEVEEGLPGVVVSVDNQQLCQLRLLLYHPRRFLSIDCTTFVTNDNAAPTVNAPVMLTSSVEIIRVLGLSFVFKSAQLRHQQGTLVLDLSQVIKYQTHLTTGNFVWIIVR